MEQSHINRNKIIRIAKKNLKVSTKIVHDNVKQVDWRSKIALLKGTQ